MIEIATGVISTIILLALLKLRIYQQKPNFRGRQVKLAGIALLITISFYLISVAILKGEGALVTVMIFSAIAGIAGWYDDVKNDPDKGLRGHLTAFFKGRITSGLVKLAAISLLALVFALMISRGIVDALVNFILVASSTNLFNLLDLRPGRTLKAVILVFLCLLIFTLNPVYTGILLQLFVFLLFDLREQVMLGDAGSNYIGFLAGIFLAISIQSFTVRAVIAVGLTILNLLSEKYSFSKIIEGNRWLRFFDMLGRGEVS